MRLEGENEKKAWVGRKVNYHNLLASYISDQTNSFCTRTFMIRYSDEEVELQDICRFKAELELTESYARIPFYLDIELFYSDLLMIDGSANIDKYANDVCGE